MAGEADACKPSSGVFLGGPGDAPMRPLPSLLLIAAALLAAGRLSGEPGETARTEWGPDSGPSREDLMKPHTRGITSIVIHHTESPNQPPAMERSRLLGIRRYHMEERGWGDLAYHYLIGPSGRIYQGREWRFQGDSGTRYDLDGRLLVCLIGSFTETMPQEAAMKSLLSLVAGKLHEHKLKPEAVTTHRLVAATDCPGERMQEWFEKEGRDAILRAYGEAVAGESDPAAKNRGVKP